MYWDNSSWNLEQLEREHLKVCACYWSTVFESMFFVFIVDSEFESVATQLLKRTQAMLNKYRCLLIEDAMVSIMRIQEMFIWCDWVCKNSTGRWELALQLILLIFFNDISLCVCI